MSDSNKRVVVVRKNFGGTVKVQKVGCFDHPLQKCGTIMNKRNVKFGWSPEKRKEGSDVVTELQEMGIR